MKIAVISLLLVISITAGAQNVANFSLTDALGNKSVSLDQFTTAGVAIVFYSNECPYDNYYKERLKSMIGAYSGKIQFILVNSYIEAEESVEKMSIHYNDLGVPYLADKDQTLMAALGAKKSPEVFLLKNTGGKFSIFYNGSIDDNAQVEKDVANPYLKNAIDQLLGGQATPESNRAVGCSIRRK